MISTDNQVFTQLPVFTQPQLQLLVPQVIPLPQVNTLPRYQLIPKSTFVPLNTNIQFWDATSNQISTSLPVGYPMPQVVNNQFVPPMGYSFVLMDVPSLPLTDSISDSSEALTITPSPSVGSVRSDQYISLPPTTVSRQGTPEPAMEEKKRKYKHRSKQERIEQVHAEVKEKYTALGLYAGEDEVLRGFDTIRVHVKTYRGLNVIDQPLDRILDSSSVQILKIATPFSMKNKFQKKGFIVYLKLAHPSQVEIVQDIFADYVEYFPKCDIALKKEDKLRLDAEKAEAEAKLAQEKMRNPTFLSQAGSKVNQLDSWDDACDFDPIFAPPTMKKAGSISSVAA